MLESEKIQDLNLVLNLELNNQLPAPEPKVIFQDDDVLVIFKPARMYVHPPESRFAKSNLIGTTCLQWIKSNLKIFPKPIHRLDFSTEGLVIFGLNDKSTKKMNEQIRGHEIKKKYFAVVRGWLKDSHGEIDLSLESDSSGEEIPCLTRYSTIKKIELPFTVNSKFTTSRYSLLDIELVTGRWHQIRRHMNRVSHPILGDREHGDSHHNRFFREQLQIHAMCLKAYRLEFTHPLKNEQISLLAPVTSEWQKIETLFSN